MSIADVFGDDRLRPVIDPFDTDGTEERFRAALAAETTVEVAPRCWQFDRGDFEDSLASFRAALAAREQDARSPELTEYARFGVARALHALDRPREAVPLLEQAVACMTCGGRDWSDARLFRDALAAARAACEIDRT